LLLLSLLIAQLFRSISVAFLRQIEVAAIGRPALVIRTICYFVARLLSADVKNAAAYFAQCRSSATSSPLQQPATVANLRQ
jgi:hypothetical protein